MVSKTDDTNIKLINRFPKTVRMERNHAPVHEEPVATHRPYNVKVDVWSASNSCDSMVLCG